MSAHAAVIEPRSPMSLNIPPEFERAILERVASGAYASTDDVLNACLQALIVLEEDLADDHEWLKREIQIGIDEADRREVIPRDEAIASIRAEVRRRLSR
jgi:Arc/MetJ-type ribon-helix-helix transcriptional regulator